MRGRGRPARHSAILVFSWVLVEIMRDRPSSGLKRHSVRAAADLLSKRLAAHGNVPAETLRREHRDMEKRLKTMYPPAEIPQQREELLREVRARRIKTGWDTDPLKLVGIL